MLILVKLLTRPCCNLYCRYKHLYVNYFRKLSKTKYYNNSHTMSTPWSNKSESSIIIILLFITMYMRMHFCKLRCFMLAKNNKIDIFRSYGNTLGSLWEYSNSSYVFSLQLFSFSQMLWKHRKCFDFVECKIYFFSFRWQCVYFKWKALCCTNPWTRNSLLSLSYKARVRVWNRRKLCSVRCTLCTTEHAIVS